MTSALWLQATYIVASIPVIQFGPIYKTQNFATINSPPIATGVKATNNTISWDKLGVYDVKDATNPNIQYVSNGVVVIITTTYPTGDAYGNAYRQSTTNPIDGYKIKFDPFNPADISVPVVTDNINYFVAKLTDTDGSIHWNISVSPSAYVSTTNIQCIINGLDTKNYSYSGKVYSHDIYGLISAEGTPFTIPKTA